ncbi:peptidase [Moorella sp. E306M]|nr:S41 family peptidase [Moorella sp. E306M]MDK2895763.1 carboxyl-terminal processing protease [Moorella sp. (in: firmicutes)]GEA17890.1 peptidase [Moorella sp. E306M]
MPRIWRQVKSGLVTLCVLVTLTLGFGVVTHFQEVQQLVKTYTLLRFQALEPINTDKLMEGAIRGMVDALDDPYSTYLDANTYRHLQESVSGSYGGVGLLITLDEKDKRLMVVSPFKGTPAQRAGIKSRDYIIAIDGRDTTGMDLETAANLMQGQPGTKVELTILSAGETNPRKVTLTREIIKVPTVDGKILPGHPSIGYISLTMFNEQTAGDLGRQLDELRRQGMQKLVLDLRNNPGGALPAAVDVASYFVAEGPVVYIADQKNTEALMARGYAKPLPLAVLVNKGSASAAEIVAGAIKDTGSGTLVGETTFGKGIVQTIFPLPGGAAVKITTHKYLTPGKHDINKKGITPDYVVPMDPQLEQQVLAHAPDLERDVQLQKALEVLEK